MKKYLSRLALFLLLPLPLLVGLHYVADKGLQRSKAGYNVTLNGIMRGTIKADALVMGTSRAWRHANPAILDSVLGYHTYNLGLDGAAFDIQFDLLSLYLHNHLPPKVIFQEVGYPTFIPSDSSEYYQLFITYFADNDIWRAVQQHCHTAGLADRWFPLYKYNNQFAMLKEGLASFAGHGQPPTLHNGFQGSNATWDSTFYFFKTFKRELDVTPNRTLIKQFDQYLAYCAQRNIKVILFSAPTYYESLPYLKGMDVVSKVIKRKAAKYNLTYLDYTSDSISFRKELFYNTQHLNATGAALFSRRLATDALRSGYSRNQ